MFLALLFLAVCSEDAKHQNTGLVSPGFITQFSGKSGGRNVYITTADGFITCVNVFSGDVIWKVYTGNPLFNYTTTGRTMYIPSIDGFLFTFSPQYGYKRLSVPIRDLAYAAPFMTESGEIFSSETKTRIIYVDPETGTIHVDHTPNDHINLTDSPIFDSDIIIMRNDYTLNIFDSTSEIIRSTEFDIVTKDRNAANATNDILIKTNKEGGLSISVNNTIVSQIRISGAPIHIFGSIGRFDYELISNGERLTKTKVFFTNSLYGPIAIPARPCKAPSKFEQLIDGLQALPGPEGLGSTQNFVWGLSDVRRPFALYRPLIPSSSTSVVDPVQVKQLQYFAKFPYQRWSLVFVLCYAANRAIDFLVRWATNANKDGDPLIVDRDDPTRGKCGQTDVSIVTLSLGDVSQNSLELSKSASNLQHTPKFYKSEKTKDKLIIAYQPLTPFDSERTDIQIFARTVLESLKSMHEHNLCHTRISEEVIFSSAAESDKIFVGGVEWCCTEFTDADAKKDVFDLGVLIKRIISRRPSETSNLLLDLLSEMLDGNPENRPTPSEALSHPFFFSSKEKIEVFLDMNSTLWSTSYPQNYLMEFEAHKIDVLQSTDWKSLIPNELLNDLQNNSNTYAYDCLRDLVRMIRNKYHHRNEIKDPNLSKVTTDDTFFDYFDKMFPNMFLYCYYFKISHPWKMQGTTEEKE